eukprot:2221840-Alexandrium_andersonii.AAC.1
MEVDASAQAEPLSVVLVARCHQLSMEADGGEGLQFKATPRLCPICPWHGPVRAGRERRKLRVVVRRP